MSNDDEQGRDLVAKAGKAPMAIPLGPHASIDLSFLPEAERNALMTDYARGALNVAKKAQDLHVEVGALKSHLDNLAHATREVADSGSGAITATYSHTGTLGRTEIKMGNTEEARSGKLSSSQSGITDWTPYYILAAIAAVVVIAFLFVTHH